MATPIIPQYNHRNPTNRLQKRQEQMAKEKSKGNEASGDILISREDIMESLIEAVQGSTAMLSAAAWALNDLHMESGSAVEVMLGCKAVLESALAEFNRREIEVGNIYERNPKRHGDNVIHFTIVERPRLAA
jgi:hypothetical protein